VDKTVPDVLTLPQHFRQNGYTTVSLGKVYHYLDDDMKGWQQPPWQPPGAAPGYVTEEAEAARRKSWEEAGRPEAWWTAMGPPVERADVPDDAYPDGKTADAAVSKLRQLQGERFLLAVGFLRPHLPLCAPARYWGLYDPAQLPFRKVGREPLVPGFMAAHDMGELRCYEGVPQRGGLREDLARSILHGYYAAVSFVDAQMGRILDELERLGMAESTVVIAWSDQGWSLGEHRLWGKAGPFEVSVRVPLVVSVPGLSPTGQKTPALTELVDLYPSLCELCGLAVPEELEGTSFVPLLGKPSRSWKTAAFSQDGAPGERLSASSIRTDRYRYTEWLGSRGHPAGTELYDELSDPQENHNLAWDRAKERIRLDLSRRLAAGWRAAVPPR
jgi:arylsulfatase A-like enzyme